MAAIDISDTKQGHNFLYVNIPLVILATALVAFRVWWRFVKNVSLNKADTVVVICLVRNRSKFRLICVKLTISVADEHCPSVGHISR